MLTRLLITNYKLIDQLDLDFQKGLTILTGETGAGKSILLDAIKLILGDRGSAQLIKNAEKPLTIEAYFADISDQINQILTSYDIEQTQQLHIYRKIDAEGKNTVRINGEPVNVKILKELSDYLVDLCSQHQHQTLFSKTNHKTILDNFGGPEIDTLRAEITTVRSQYLILKEKCTRIKNDQSAMEKEKSFLLFQITELNDAALHPDEEDQLLAKKNRLENITRLADESSAATKYLTQTDENLRKANTALTTLIRLDSTNQPILDSVQTALYSVEDAIRELGLYQDTLECSPDVLEQLNERIFLINNLKRKYGPQYADIFTVHARLKTQWDDLSSPDNDLPHLQSQLDAIEQKLATLSVTLSGLRKKTALKIEKLLTQELHDLMLPHSIFEINIRQISEEDGLMVGPQRVKLFSDGIDDVEFLFSANPGTKPAELKNIASGGELSRVMLALKAIFIRSTLTPTIIFDEIDTGISGNTAIKIAQKLNDLGNTYQVICVTHMANIAAQGKSHLYISKEVHNDQTSIRTAFIHGSQREQEIARLLGGTQTSITLQHARELLQQP